MTVRDDTEVRRMTPERFSEIAEWYETPAMVPAVAPDHPARIHKTWLAELYVEVVALLRERDEAREAGNALCDELEAHGLSPHMDGGDEICEAGSAISRWRAQAVPVSEEPQG